MQNKIRTLKRVQTCEFRKRLQVVMDENVLNRARLVVILTHVLSTAGAVFGASVHLRLNIFFKTKHD